MKKKREWIPHGTEWTSCDINLLENIYKNRNGGDKINWPTELLERHSIGACQTRASHFGLTKPLREQLTDWSKITELDLAYLAGIIDGEGCLNYCKTRKYKYCRLTISNTASSLMAWLVDKFGAGAQNREQRRPIEERKNRKPCYIFLVSAQNELHELLIRVEKYLVIKKSKAKECINYIETVLWDLA